MVLSWKYRFTLDKQTKIWIMNLKLDEINSEIECELNNVIENENQSVSRGVTSSEPNP